MPYLKTVVDLRFYLFKIMGATSTRAMRVMFEDGEKEVEELKDAEEASVVST